MLTVGVTGVVAIDNEIAVVEVKGVGNDEAGSPQPKRVIIEVIVMDSTTILARLSCIFLFKFLPPLFMIYNEINIKRLGLGKT